MRPTSHPRLVNAADVPDQVGRDSIVFDLAKAEIQTVAGITRDGKALLTTGVVVALDRLEVLR